ncbi:hypothetical protein HMPREF3151_06115 [Corynebacterium sp. HMSC05H05]|uniref:HNH endonuclease signature motif containing protein n=1 Tax=Corynebacterium sp. HMSC05H05 TaxID=1581119 RepID=UPI0008A5673F|nr:HNH endonuclease signature motif containing protein [Corynebacterium sp. HMSC05H05]OFT57807.1 hypothetical protein HMPREF3151_06115 [Corynebacterium sp. HMSC05H05]
MSAVLDQAVNQIVDGLRSLANEMREPDSLHLASTHVAMERLHACLPLLSNADAAFAFLCDRDGAGALVGANHAVEYLTRSLGLSRREAFALLEQGKRLYGEPEVPEPEPSENKEDRKRKEQEAEARRKKAREARERARRAAEKANAEKKRIITNALKDLNEHANPGYEEILAEAMEAAESLTAEELRKFVRDQVKRANKRGRDYDGEKDPLAAWKKRGIWLGEPDADGGSYFNGYLDAASRAKLEACLAAGDHMGSNMEGEDAAKRDSRRKHQRRLDQLMNVLDRYGDAATKSRGGVGTVVISLTLDDLLEADAFTEFATNTSVSLTPLDIVRLGLAGDSFILQLDSATGVPLSLGRTRLASVEQKLVLLAMQGVCAWNGCTKPGVELEAHHLDSYLSGGLTSIENLVLLCREHHMCNNDNKDGAGNKGHFGRDPDTGEVHYHPGNGGPPGHTTTYQYRNSPGQRLAKKARSRHGGNHNRPPDPALFDPDG